MKDNLFASLLLISGLLAFPAVGSAALVIDGVVATPTNLTISATWSDPDPGVIFQTTSFWEYAIGVNSTGPFAQIVHRFAPHPGEIPIAGGIEAVCSLVSPGIGSCNMTDARIHINGTHADTLTLAITPIAGSLSSSVTITAVHGPVVPEPATSALLATGLTALALWRNRQQLR